MSSGLAALDQDTRTQGLAGITAYANGTKPWPEFAAELRDLTGADLMATMKAADQKAAQAPNNLALRMTAAFAYAVWRDFMYGVAQGRFPTALGANNAMRGLYEGGRINIDATATTTP